MLAIYSVSHVSQVFLWVFDGEPCGEVSTVSLLNLSPSVRREEVWVVVLDSIKRGLTQPLRTLGLLRSVHRQLVRHPLQR